MTTCCNNFLTESIIRSSHRRCSVKKAALKKLTNFTEKHPCWSLFLIKLLANFIKKRLQDRCFPLKLREIFKNIYFEEHLRIAAASLSTTNLATLHCFHQKIFQQEIVISKKRNFFGKTLDFLPPWKPGLYISRLLFFSSLNIMNFQSIAANSIPS